MNPFSKYIDCINCGNELINVSELTFQTPTVVRCDYCGQEYPGLAQRIRRTKGIVSLLFVLLAAVVFWMALQASGFTSGLFALFPLFILYLFVLGRAVRKSAKL